MQTTDESRLCDCSEQEQAMIDANELVDETLIQMLGNAHCDAVHDMNSDELIALQCTHKKTEKSASDGR